MKKIIIGACRTGKTYKKVLSTILNYTGKILFISGKDEIDYLDIDNLFIKQKVFDTSGRFNDSIITDWEKTDKNLFIECTTTQECHLIGRLLTETSILDNDNLLLIIDEGLIILGNIEWDMLSTLADKDANILIIF